MHDFFLFVLFTMSLLILVYLYRAIYGPTIFDRLLGLNGISTKAILLLVLLGTLYERLDMFVDIGVGYGVLSMVGSLAAAKYLEKEGLQ